MPWFILLPLPAAWCNGSTPRSGRGSRGSNPWAAAWKYHRPAPRNTFGRPARRIESGAWSHRLVRVPRFGSRPWQLAPAGTAGAIVYAGAGTRPDRSVLRILGVKKLQLGVALVMLCVAFSACGSSGGGSTQSTAATGTPNQAAAHPASSSVKPRGTDPLPSFEPSRLITKAPGHLRLVTSSLVPAVTRFYAKALLAGGWTIVSTQTSGYDGDFTARRGDQRVRIAIAPVRPAGTSVAIKTSPGLTP